MTLGRQAEAEIVVDKVPCRVKEILGTVTNRALH
jgi:hypothetical protein